MDVEVKIKPFRLPSFVSVHLANDPNGTLLSVGRMTEAQAEAYWDDMKEEWLAHVAQKREMRERANA